MNMRRKSRNEFYYIGLIMIHILLLLFTFYKKTDRKNMLLSFLSIVGLAFYFEYPLYILKAYTYKTKLLKNKEQDSSFGSVLSQGLFVPSAALFISAFQFRWKVKVLLTMYFVCIERLFLKMNIFKNNWWHTTCTATSIFAYFFISDAWYSGLKKGNTFILKMTLYHTFHVVNMMLLFSLSLFKRFRFQPIPFTRQPWYVHYSFIKIYVVVETIVSTLLIEQNKKWIKVLPLFLIVAVDSILFKMNILKVKGSYWIQVFPVRFIAHVASLALPKWIETDGMNHSKGKII